VLGVCAFGFTLLTTKGLTNDHYMYLGWAQQVQLGDVPGRDFVDPGMPLQYMLSAAALSLMPGPAAEVLVTTALLGLAAGFTCFGVSRLTGSLTAGVLAATFQTSLDPRLYSYPKVLVPAVALVLALAYARRPGRRTLAAMALWTATAFLLRPDLGMFTGVMVAIVVAATATRMSTAAVNTGMLAAFTAAALVPYVLYVAWAEGVAWKVAAAFEFLKGESHQFGFYQPPLRLGALLPAIGVPAEPIDGAAFLYYLSYALIAATIVLLALRWRRIHAHHRPVLLGLVALAAMFGVVIIRHPITARIPDAAAVIAILGSWCTVETIRAVSGLAGGAGMAARTAAWGTVTMLLTLTAVSVDALGHVREEIRESQITEGLGSVRARALSVIHDGETWPWAPYWPAGDIPEVVTYIRECTRPQDRLLMTWPAPEFFFFAQRGFSAGHVMLQPGTFTGPEHQRLMVSRLERDRPPIALINETGRPAFAASFPAVDAYVSRRYLPVQRFSLRDGSKIVLAVRSDWHPTGSYGRDRLPCEAAPATVAVGRP